MRSGEYAARREDKQHVRPEFPYNTYLCTIPQDFARVPLHWHDEMEIIYVKKGRGTVTIQLQPHPVSAGCIALAPPGTLHAIDGQPGGRMEYENILFSRDLLLSAAGDWCDSACLRPLISGGASLPAVLRPGSALHRGAAGCLDEADAACSAARPGYPLLVKSALYRLFYTLYAAVGQRLAVPPPEAERVKKALAFVAAHQSEKLTVTQAANAAGYSPAHFMRFFKAAVGQTFVEYVTDRRLSAAARALAESETAVRRIAEDGGFESPSYFCRLFRRKYGVSPGRYRARAQSASGGSALPRA